MAANQERVAQQKRTDIVDAALGLFASRGFHGVSTKEIAATAKVSERTLFKHFHSKSELKQELLEVFVLQVSGTTDHANLPALLGDTEGSLEDWYVRLMVDRYRLLATHREGARLLVQELLTGPDAMDFGAMLWKSLSEPSTAAVQQFQKRGLLRSDLDADVIQSTAFAINLALIIESLIRDYDEAQFAAQARVRLRLMLHGLAPSETR